MSRLHHKANRIGSNRKLAAAPADAPAAEAGVPNWGALARPEQTPPHGEWRTWIFLGGRGSGKTRAGAEWIRHLVESGQCGRIALIGPTFHDVREVMIEGPSGLRAISPAPPRYESSRRRLIWPNEALGLVFSAEDPDGLRGAQFSAAWGDEFCAWRKPDLALAMLRMGLRLGADPRLVLTSTPRAIPALKRLLAEPNCVRTKATTQANAANLSQAFLEAIEARYGGTLLGRQELEGEIVEDRPGALWRRAAVEDFRSAPPAEFDRIVVGVDPPVSVGPNADSCGIIVAARAPSGPYGAMCWVLEDASIQGVEPHVWAQRAAQAFRRFDADAIVAEGNQGGALVRAMLELAAPEAPIRIVHASRGKRARAEPIAALYSSGRIKHAGRFSALEDEMCEFGAEDQTGSPDRVDALVWALWALMFEHAAGPRLRPL